MGESTRGWVLTIFAILFAILALSNFLKPFHLDPNAGFVFLGTRQSGVPNMILGPVFGVYLIVYAAGIWRMKRHALPMAYAYAAYVVLNLILYGSAHGFRPIVFGIVYIVIAVGVAGGSAILLHQRRADLR